MGPGLSSEPEGGVWTERPGAQPRGLSRRNVIGTSHPAAPTLGRGPAPPQRPVRAGLRAALRQTHGSHRGEFRPARVQSTMCPVNPGGPCVTGTCWSHWGRVCRGPGQAPPCDPGTPPRVWGSPRPSPAPLDLGQRWAPPAPCFPLELRERTPSAAAPVRTERRPADSVSPCGQQRPV